MQAMVERNARYRLSGDIQVDDAYLGGELAGGKAGRGSENKVPFVAALSLNPEGQPRFIKMAPIPGFTRKAIAIWAQGDLSPGCIVRSDGLACFAGVTDADCQHQVIIAGGRKTQGPAGILLDQYGAGQSQNQSRRCLPCFRFRKIRHPLLRCVCVPL